jgi:hypothetical protein
MIAFVSTTRKNGYALYVSNRPERSKRSNGYNLLENAGVFLNIVGVAAVAAVAARKHQLELCKDMGFHGIAPASGDIFAIKEWFYGGRPRSSELRHGCQTLDWIVQNFFKEAPLMEGHQGAQERVNNPGLTFVRKAILW